MNNRNLIIALIVIVVIILGGWWIYTRDNGNNSYATVNSGQSTGNPMAKALQPEEQGYERTATGAVVVRYNGSAFAPNNVIITHGEAVHFVNDSGVALNLSPADTVNQPYATFDQNKSIGLGGSYDYTFNEVGSYAYFNQNKKTDTGTITVK